MTSANLRAQRADKPPVLADRTDRGARDPRQRLASGDDPLLRRWERIAQERRA